MCRQALKKARVRAAAAGDQKLTEPDPPRAFGGAEELALVSGEKRVADSWTKVLLPAYVPFVVQLRVLAASDHLKEVIRVAVAASVA